MAVARTGALYAPRAPSRIVHVYAIDRDRRAETPVHRAPRGELPLHSLDATGAPLRRSYAGHLVSVNAVGGDGRVLASPCSDPVGRNAIRSSWTRPTATSTSELGTDRSSSSSRREVDACL